MRTIIELTADGSHTLFVPELNEHYHSVNGAIQESKHVYIEAGLKQIQKNQISIFEVGFGTGLNALLTLQENERNENKLQIHYTTIEAFPLSEIITKNLNYPDEKGILIDLHSAQWNALKQITPFFHLYKMEESLLNITFDSIDKKFDLIYFDAFAPDKQPEMWTQNIFNKLYNQCNQNAIVVTYCAKGSVRRMLQYAGFFVERIPGPPGKREMLRATKK